MLNQQIGPYKIISKLGEGGMANVYLAEKGSLAKKVALKVLKDEFLLNQHIRNRFLSEAKKMSSLNHANIVGVHDLIDEKDFVAIELDYVEGKTLKQHLHEKGALPDEEIESLFKQMLDAVGYVHENGFVHRDVKPSNFMLTENGIIKLTDFGIAKNVDDSNVDYTGTGTGMQMGTPKYMSPEQVRSMKDVDHRTDIYSLGVVLWEMVTGKVPYDIETSSTFDVFTKIVNEPLKKTNTRWDEVIQKATSKNENDRYQNLGGVTFGKDNQLKKVETGKEKKYRKYIIGSILFILVIISVVLFPDYSSQKIENPNNSKNSIEKLIYQCPMDCEEGKTYKENGQCPVCEMNLAEFEKEQSIVVKNDKINNTFQDPRDNKIYKWVKIGEQTWMAENLAYKPLKGGYWSYAGSSFNVDKYGYLYDWETACKVCPEGWHLPSDKDWKELEVTMGMLPSDANGIEWRGSKEGDVLKGSDGFSGLYGGARNIKGNFHSVGTHGYWWATTENGNKAWRRFIDTYQSNIYRSTLDKRTGLSVRCLKNKDDYNEINPAFREEESENNLEEGFQLRNKIDVLFDNENKKEVYDGYTVKARYKLGNEYIEHSLPSQSFREQKFKSIKTIKAYNNNPLDGGSSFLLPKDSKFKILKAGYIFYETEKVRVTSMKSTRFEFCESKTCDDIYNFGVGDFFEILCSSYESSWYIIINGQLKTASFSHQWRKRRIETSHYDNCCQITGDIIHPYSKSEYIAKIVYNDEVKWIKVELTDEDYIWEFINVDY